MCSNARILAFQKTSKGLKSQGPKLKHENDVTRGCSLKNEHEPEKLTVKYWENRDSL